ncbi:MAG: hypothetical protein IID18_01230 [Nitrospinae bacterium]|nr:hypothetical protein [Nitrospinota bacterium]
MNIIDIDYKKGTLQSDYYTWQIVANDNNKFLLLQRDDNGRYRAAEADVKKKHLWEVKEISFRGPEGDTYFFDEETGVDKV